MNNLAILTSRPLDLPKALDGAAAIRMAVDANQLLLCVATDDYRITGVPIKDGAESFDAELPSPSAILSMHPVPELDALFLPCEDGTLLLLHLEGRRFETVGDLEGGLLSASGSPDGELMLCLTASLTMVALSASWEVLSEIELDASIAGPGLRPAFAWQEDGLKVAMLSEDASGARVVSVYDRTLTLEFRSDPLPNLGNQLAFSPDGALIATSQRVGEGDAAHLDIIFFEPNALRHYEFSLPARCASATVAGLSWNADGSLLAVCLEGMSGSGDEELLDAVQVPMAFPRFLVLSQSWSLQFGETRLFSSSRLTHLCHPFSTAN